jgi:hypothetical protein
MGKAQSSHSTDSKTAYRAAIFATSNCEIAKRISVAEEAIAERMNDSFTIPEPRLRQSERLWMTRCMR